MTTPEALPLLPPLRWTKIEPAGPEPDPMRRLAGTLEMDGQSFYADLIEVVERDGFIVSRLPESDTYFSDLIDMLQGPPETVEYQGRQYAVVIMPHSR